MTLKFINMLTGAYWDGQSNDTIRIGIHSLKYGFVNDPNLGKSYCPDLKNYVTYDKKIWHEVKL